MVPLKKSEISCCNSHFFCKKWKIFVMYWWFVYFLFWNSVLGVAARTNLLVLSEFEDSSWSTCFQESEFWVFSCRLTWERSTSGFGVVCTSLLVPCPSSTFTGLTGYPTSCVGFSLALHGLRNAKLTGLVFAGTICFGIVIGEPSLELTSWAPFDMALCNRTSRNSSYQTNEEDGSTHHTGNFLWLACQPVDFWCKQIWFGSLGPSWFCRTTNQAQLCAFWRRVSLLYFVLWQSSWSQLHYLQKWTTETRLEKNVRWWVRNPHLTVVRILAFSFSFGVLVLFLLMVWSLFPHKSLWAGLPCLAVLFVERNTSITMSERSRASSPSMRNPASKEMISDSVKLCRILTFVSCTSDWWRQNVRLPKIHKTFLLVDFESSRSSAKTESWNKPNLQCWSVFSHDNVVGVHLREESVRSILSIVCRMPGFIFWLLLQVCWHHRMSGGPPIHAKYKHFWHNLWANLWILRLIEALLVWIDDHPCKDLKLCLTAPLSCSPI